MTKDYWLIFAFLMVALVALIAEQYGEYRGEWKERLRCTHSITEIRAERFNREKYIYRYTLARLLPEVKIEEVE